MNEYIIKYISFVIIFFNFLIRSIYPSQYVPYQRTSTSFLGNIYLARTLATFAELAFYRQVTRSLNVNKMWINNKSIGILLALWFIAECISWIGLIFQSYEANALEDTMWCIWFILAFIYSKQNARYILIPIILYYITCHLPSLIIRLKNKPLTPVKQLATCLDASGSWVVPSVTAKLILYIIFVYIEKYEY